MSKKDRPKEVSEAGQSVGGDSDKVDNSKTPESGSPKPDVSGGGAAGGGGSEISVRGGSESGGGERGGSGGGESLSATETNQQQSQERRNQEGQRFAHPQPEAEWHRGSEVEGRHPEGKAPSVEEGGASKRRKRRSNYRIFGR